MSDSTQGRGWWLASDGRWYPPELWTGPPQAGGAVPARQRSTNGFAVASLLCSCAGILLVGVPSVVGIVFGFVARARIRESNGTQKGNGLAIAGIVVGFVVVWLVLLVIVVNAIMSSTGH